jgi:hypothetical protein
VTARLTGSRFDRNTPDGAHAYFGIQRIAPQSKGSSRADDSATACDEFGNGGSPCRTDVIGSGAIQIKVAKTDWIVVRTVDTDRHPAHVIQISSLGKRLSNDFMFANANAFIQRSLVEGPGNKNDVYMQTSRQGVNKKCVYLRYHLRQARTEAFVQTHEDTATPAPKTAIK